MKKAISLIIPVCNDPQFFRVALDSIKSELDFVYEIIVVDSSSDSNHLTTNQIIRKFNNPIVRVLKLNKLAYPGEARNIGIINSKADFIGFLDSKTYCKPGWLKNAYEYLSSSSSHEFYGSMIYAEANTLFQKILRASSYGSIDTRVLVGSVFKREILNRVGLLNESVRSGEDLDWIKRVGQQGVDIHYPTSSFIIYNGLELNLFAAINKYFIYSLQSSKVDILNSYRGLYFYTVLLFTLFIVFNWNATYAQWDEANPLYIPYITKISITLFFITYILLRGIIRPFARKESLSFMLPFNWIGVAFVSLILDLVKLPGYLIGYFRNVSK